MGRPSNQILIFLTLYDFTYTNPLFAHLFLTTIDASFPPPNPSASPTSSASSSSTTTAPPFPSYLSLTSYILHHAHRSNRTTNYALLSLLTIRLLTESPQLIGVLYADQKDRLISPRLCRQRPPFLPELPSSKGRVAAEAILDICVDGINHNLKLRLNVGLYSAMIYPIHRMVSYLARTKTKSLAKYHWTVLWQSLISLLRFLITYSAALNQQNSMATLKEMTEPLLATLALAVSRGEDFLPVGAAYDDLIYKLVEVGPGLFENLGKAFAISRDDGIVGKALDVLLALTKHYYSLLPTTTATSTTTSSFTSTEPPPAAPSKTLLSPNQVLKVIKKGYETLSLPTSSAEGLDRWDPWRETASSGHKALMKRIARIAVEDGRKLGK